MIRLDLEAQEIALDGPEGEQRHALASPEAFAILTEAGRAAVIAAARPSHLLHLAWEARPGLYRDSPDNPAWTAASLDLLDRAQAAGAERVLGIGTCFEYGPYDGPCVEGVTPCRPATLYGQAKRAGAEGFVGAGAAWGRVFFPFGPGEPRAKLIPALIRRLIAACRCSRIRNDEYHISTWRTAELHLQAVAWRPEATPWRGPEPRHLAGWPGLRLLPSRWRYRDSND